eukprot:11186855-Lingulodinium_polyedra.AAC.1
MASKLPAPNPARGAPQSAPQFGLRTPVANPVMATKTEPNRVWKTLGELPKLATPGGETWKRNGVLTTSLNAITLA